MISVQQLTGLARRDRRNVLIRLALRLEIDRIAALQNT